LKDGAKEVTLLKGSEFTLTTDVQQFKEGSESQVYIDYTNIVKVVQTGDKVLIDDGLISCIVTEVGDNYLKTKIENTGKLGTKKGVNLPGIKVDLPALTKRDKEDLAFGVKNGVDFIAASFIRKKQDVVDIRQELGKKGSNIKIISKIENLEGLDNFDDILTETDGVMVIFIIKIRLLEEIWVWKFH
jgi:pyruvate kinase